MRRTRRPAEFVEPPPLAGIKPEVSPERRMVAIQSRMAWFDGLPADLRRVADAAPTPDLFFFAVQDGVSSFEEMEDWLRRTLGPSVVE